MGELRKSSAGIYAITVTSSDGDIRRYVGQSSNLSARKSYHFWELRAGRHKNPALQAAFDKHGYEAFAWHVLVVCDRDADLLNLYEQRIVDHYIAEYGDRSIFNVHRISVRSRLGAKSSAETRARQSFSLQGRKLSAQQIEGMRQRQLGKKLGPESIAKRTAKQKGRKQSLTEREKRASTLRGRIHTAASRAKISASKSGQCTGAMLAHIKNLAVLNKGSKRDPEHMARLAAEKRGISKPSEEIARRQETRRQNAELRGYW